MKSIGIAIAIGVAIAIGFFSIRARKNRNPISASTPIAIPIAMEFGCGMATPWKSGKIRG